MRRVLLSLVLCVTSCDGVWSSYRGAMADHCVVTPSRCGMNEECNPQTGQCQPSTAPKLTIQRLTDCEASSLIAALSVPDPVGYQIVLKAGCTYTFTAAASYWFGPSALPLIDKKVVIEGSGAVLEGGAASGQNFRLATVAGSFPPSQSSSVESSGTLILRNLTVRGFSVKGGNGGFGDAGPNGSGAGGGGAGLGGAFFVQGRLELYGVTLSGNRAQGGNGSGASTANSLGGAGGGGGLGGGGGSGGNGRSGGGGGGFRYEGCIAGSTGKVGAGGGFLESCESSALAREGGLGGTNFSVGGKGLAGSTPGSPSSMHLGGAGGGSGGLGGAGGVAAANATAAGQAGGAAGDGGGGGGGGILSSVGAIGGGGGAGFLGGGGGSSSTYPTAIDPSGGGGGGGFGGGGGGGTSYSGGGGGGVGGGGGGASVSSAQSSTFSGGGGGGFGGGGGGGSVGGNGGFGGGGGNYAGKGGFGGGTAGPAFRGGGSGGGLGAGGALFVLDGIVIVANSTLYDNAVKGGAGGEQATAASSLGGAIFNLNGSVSLYNSTIVRNETMATAAGLPATNCEGGAVYHLALGNATKTASLAIYNSILSDSRLGSPTAHDLAIDSRAAAGSAKLTVGAANFFGSVDSSLGLPSQGSAGLPDSPDVSNGPAVFVPPIGSAVVNVGESAICYGPQVAGRDARGQLRHASCTLGAIEADILQAPGCSYVKSALPKHRMAWLSVCSGVLCFLLLRRRRRRFPST